MAPAGSKGAGTRPRFSGDVAELVLQVAPIVGPLGRPWLDYSKHVKARTDEKKIKGMLRDAIRKRATSDAGCNQPIGRF